MYSEKISKELKKSGIGPGDRVSFNFKGTQSEGELMPSTEANAFDIVVIKLDNGYNIGVDFYASRLRLIAKRKGKIAFPKAKIKQAETLPKVSVVYTGGTIGSRVDYKTGGVSTLQSPEELFYTVPELAGIARIEPQQLFNISSEDMTSAEWQKIAESVASKLNHGSRGVVITHGTDTMHFTAAALSFMLEGLNAPVVITGSQRSPDRGSSDAFMNLICSAHAAARSDVAEVSICMHSSSSDDRCALMRGTKTRKMHTSRRDAFKPINDSPIALIAQSGAIEYTGNSYRRVVREERRKIVPRAKFERRVALVKPYPGASPEIMEFYIGKGYRGMIIEGTGLGHTPVSTRDKEDSWLPAIKRAVSSGMVVGMTSQTLHGRVHPSVYKNLRLLSNAGVIYCEDMLPETAYVKLGWLLGNHTRDKAAEMLPKNLVGEIKGRSEYNDFGV
ncbi:MAG: Glu-tRNA(Gln) amidotransferase subunit GatD [Candidatus Micrarchaeota archaeon]|nr:Glu-tRNA(Gln) amidotransferase subunit GatD [Candidatus Micrarchaeota archaeon]